MPEEDDPPRTEMLKLPAERPARARKNAAELRNDPDEPTASKSGIVPGAGSSPNATGATAALRIEPPSAKAGLTGQTAALRIEPPAAPSGQTGQTAALRIEPPSSGKGPARMAIPIDQLPVRKAQALPPPNVKPPPLTARALVGTTNLTAARVPPRPEPPEPSPERQFREPPPAARKPPPSMGKDLRSPRQDPRPAFQEEPPPPPPRTMPPMAPQKTEGFQIASTMPERRSQSPHPEVAEGPGISSELPTLQPPARTIASAFEQLPQEPPEYLEPDEPPPFEEGREDPRIQPQPTIAVDTQGGIKIDTNPDLHAPVPHVTTTGKRETMTPETPGRYDMKREFGRGGQSTVWLALDRHIGREVAFKQLLPQHGGSGEKSAVSSMSVRFLREARITGQLEHPSIVPVYEVGRRVDGSFYYTQKLVRGRTFSDALSRCKTLRERLGLLPHFIDLCQAIAYAHKRGVIHRDIKPDNVMVGEFGETVVLDWGLAKQLDESKAGAPEEDEENLARTQEGDIMGTPAYMSPEQAQGHKREIDAQSDVWSLGAVLYEILAGRPPFVGRNLMTMLLAVAKDPIPEPREFEKTVPPEMAAIAMKALTREREQRYSSALDLIHDVEAWRTGRKVRVYRYTPWGTAAVWLKANRAIAITAACVMIALGVGSIRVAMENRVARRNLAEALLEKADAASRNLSWGRAAVYAAAARDEDDSAEARWRAAHRGPIEVTPLLRVQLPGPVDRLALSSDGQMLAVALSGMGVHLVGPNGQDLHALESPPEAVSQMIFSSDSALLAVASGNATVVFNTDSGEQVARLEGAGHVEQLAFSADSSLLAAAEGNSARIYQVQSWKPLAKFEGHAGQVRGVAFTNDLTGLATTGEDGTLRFWTPLPLKEGQHAEMKMLRGEGHSPVSRLGFAPVGHLLIAASSDGMVRFFDLDRGDSTGKPELQGRLSTGQGALVDLVSATQGLLASLGQDNSVLLLDSLAQAEVARVDGDDSATAVALSADGGRLATANRDGKLRLWKLSPGAHVTGLEGTDTFSDGDSVAFSPSSKQVAAGDGAGHIQVWDTANGKREGEMSMPHGPVESIAWAADGMHLAAAGGDDQITIFDIVSAEHVTLDGHQGAVHAIAYSPDGKTLASVGQDGQLILWDPVAETQKAAIAVSPQAVYAVAFSRDGKLVAASGEDKIIHVFDVATKKQKRKIAGSADIVFALAFSPHNALIASAGRDEAVRLFHLASGKLRSVWSGHGARIYSIAFSVDGQILASASADGTMRLWDVHTGRQVVRLERAPEPRGLAFSNDGTMLASVGDRPALQLIELDNTKTLLKPKPEMDRQLAKYKLKFDGIQLIDDVAAMQGKPWKLAPVEQPDNADENADGTSP